VTTGRTRVGAVPGRPTWSDLGWKARAWRAIHVGWAVAQLASLALIWTSAIRRRRSTLVDAAVAFVGLEGAALVVGRGNCPVGELQASWGDPVPCFELVLPPRAAKAAVPVLAVVGTVGIGLLAVRRPPPVAGETG
jgi:hypothetical protein